MIDGAEIARSLPYREVEEIHMARRTETTNLWTVVQVLEVTGALTGQNICVTGHLSLPRDQIHGIIRQAGGNVHNDVVYDTTLLVSNGDWTAVNLAGGKKSSKAIKAEQNRRTKVISEQALVQMIIDKGQQSSMPVDQ